jgi:HK97 gp10 family phage protein
MASTTPTSSGGLSMHVEDASLARVLARFKTMSAETNSSLAAALNTGAHIVESSAKSKVRVKTGRLKDSIHTVDATPEKLEAQVIADTSYAAAIEKGTVPHAIVATSGVALSFTWEAYGEDVAFKSVQHPGSKAYPFMAPALSEHTEDIKASIMLALQMELMKL